MFARRAPVLEPLRAIGEIDILKRYIGKCRMYHVNEKICHGKNHRGHRKVKLM